MTVDIVAYWSRLKDGEKIHPDDRRLFDAIGREKHGFDLDCLPSCFQGPIATAPVVLLYLSPGLKEETDRNDAASIDGQKRYRETRAGRSLLWGPDQHEFAWRWWKARTECFGSWQDVRPHVAILNISGYHSRTFNDWPLLTALPSCRATVSWAQAELFPQAVNKKRVVICLRSSRHWGLAEGRNGGFLYAPPVTRAGHMLKSPLRDEIISVVRSKISQAERNTTRLTT